MEEFTALLQTDHRSNSQPNKEVLWVPEGKKNKQLHLEKTECFNDSAKQDSAETSAPLAMDVSPKQVVLKAAAGLRTSGTLG